MNAFFAGVRKVSPAAEVFVVFTGAYLNPDRTRGAFKILYEEQGVDMVAGQQGIIIKKKKKTKEDKKMGIEIPPGQEKRSTVF